MNYKESVKTVLSNYLTFTGRASLSEYWWFILFTVIVSFAFGILGALFITPDGTTPLWVDIISWLVWLVLFLPSIAVSVRRMHDIGKGGGWIFINFVPLIGWIWFIVLAATPGQPGDNRFGPMPR